MADDAEGRRRRASRRRHVGASSGPPASEHPYLCTVDASSFDVERLRPLLESKSFSDRLEFVHMPDVSIRELFVTERVIDKARGELLIPPRHHKRTLKQIQDWFMMGKKQ